MDTNKLKNLAKDLSNDFPRSPRETLGGYVLAGRILDKCRATLAGTNGEYHFNCPLDNFFFNFAGILGRSSKRLSRRELRMKRLPNGLRRRQKKDRG
jgi:hypothetical protein